MSNGVGDISPGSNAPPPRDYYPSSNTWTTTAAETSSNLAYAGNDGRPYSFAQESYKAVNSGIPPMKHETSSYNSSARGSFDNMNNYSWTAA